MGLFDQMKMAQDLMKNMDPEELKGLMAKANEAQAAMREQVQALVEEEIAKRGLITRQEVEKMLRERND
ncbi:hypothetical protein COV04_01855 [Candidatus Uhrbacteria bacterium CG10_big_fil_rev_8_21_14_0_10_48_11]|uniref:Uncharacterized protein n=1 Tax=Candidatus Uhrbacteria bacterium CG10_big_fil_rev_8_21_14_0_10_48_11 TaxID=1975037 RepID=A0A2M8LEU2_9BACT|nr:MAG: hypothetical protein COV04_01855 [Candidatus Uhrbacteria bacterium CG10_big_fil_rev_8_21_14_0_10_48_11]